jgi:predicted transcriptional regulator
MNVHGYVHEVMSHPVFTVGPDASLERVAAVLSERRVAAVPVVEETGRVIGIVTESDLLRREGTAAETAAEIMSAPVVTVPVGAETEQARRTMLWRGIGRLPVLDGSGRLVGIISRRDVIAARTPMDAELRRRVIDRVIDAGGEALGASVTAGAVSLHATVYTRSQAALVEHMVRSLPGVKRLDAAIDFRVDDMPQWAHPVAPRGYARRIHSRPVISAARREPQS